MRESKDWQTYWLPIPKANELAYNKYYSTIYAMPYIRFSSLFIGALGSYLKINSIDKKIFKIKSLGKILLATSFLLILLVFFLQDYNENKSILFQLVYRELFSVGFMIACLYVLNKKKNSSGLFYKLSYPIFQLSYGIYLIHIFVQIYIIKLSNISSEMIQNPNMFLIYACAIGVLSFLISGILVIPIYVLIEKPFINIRERYFPQKTKTV